MNPRYRPEIDGLRAVAVLPVIFFHAGLELFSGGFVGVDVFFVISGYLITLIIHKEIGAGNFSIVKFYERRVRRILPALFAVCLACIPFTWLWMMPGEFMDFSQSLVAVNLFVSNILFWREANYFAPAAELKPLLHTWSLAVEEQFYIFFPLILLIFRKVRNHTLAILLLITVCVSLGLSEWASHRQPTANFYLLPTRAWELGAGSLVAILLGQRRLESRALREAGSMIGMALILYSIILYDGSIRFPGLSAAVPVLGAMLIIACTRTGDTVGRILSWRPFVAIGLISYSAYLWHQPVFAFARIRSLAPLSDPALITLGLASLALAYLSWRFIEQPFRNNEKFSRREIFSLAAIFSGALVAAGATGHLTGGFPSRLSGDAAKMASYRNDLSPYAKECSESESRAVSPEESCVHNENGSPRIAVWGDSHAMAVIDELAKAVSSSGLSVRNLALNGCHLTLAQGSVGVAEACVEHNKAVPKFLASSTSVDTVVLLWRWTAFLEGAPFDNREGGSESGTTRTEIPASLLAAGKSTPVGTQTNRTEAVGYLYRDTVERLLKLGKRVILIYPVPEAGWDVPIRLAKEIHYGFDRMEPLSTSSEVFWERNRATLAQLDRLPDSPNLIRVRPDRVLCDTFVVGRCVVQLDGIPLYFDDDHLSSAGAALLAQNIVKEMNARGWIEE